MNIWSYDMLWQKAKLYARRALAEDRDDPAFALWSTLALEFVARCTLASVHPALVADGREPDNLLYAFGYRTDKLPKSIPAKALFARCEVIAPAFTAAERTFAMMLIERRNEELHSGSPAFHGLPTSEWLSEYFRVCTILLEAHGKKLGHLIGGDEARVARRMIAATESNRRSKVLGMMATLREAFEGLGAEYQKEGRRAGGLRARANTLNRPLARRARCPVCAAYGAQTGQRVRSSEPVADEDTIIIRTVVLPTRYECYCCGLTLSNHAETLFAGIGDQYTVTEYLDPAEFYNLQYISDDPWEDEYMNE